MGRICDILVDTTDGFTSVPAIFDRGGIDMKRWIILLVILCGLVCIVGCGESAETPTDVKSEPTEMQQQAVKKAESQLEDFGYSYEGLIEKLQAEGVASQDAVYAADNCGADWKEQALVKAKAHLQSIAYSYQGLLNKLKYDNFTDEQAQYGVDNCGADWNQQAERKAKAYLDIDSFDEDKLLDQLLYDGFTQEQAQYGVQSVTK